MFEITKEGQEWLDWIDAKYHIQSVDWSRLGIPSSLRVPKRKKDIYWILSDILAYGRPTGALSAWKLELLSEIFELGLIELSDGSKKFYHATSSKNIPSILEEGLIPEAFKTGLTKGIPPEHLLGKGTAGTYLEPGFGRWAGERASEVPIQVGYYGSIIEKSTKEPATILEVDLPPEVPIIRDPGLPGGAKALKRVLPKYIKVLDIKPEDLR